MGSEMCIRDRIAAWGAFLPYDERGELAELVLEGFGVDLEDL